jgi:hypothetical protein
MAKLIWDVDRDYQIGLDRGVFFPQDGPAEAWNGLVSVDENTDLVESGARYIDGVKLGRSSREDSFAATISAFTYPESLSPRIPFGLSYRVQTEKSYLIHLVYNALARRSNRSYVQSDTTPFKFELSTRPTPIFDAKAAAHLVIDPSVAPPTTLSAFEDLIYGSNNYDPRMPTAQEVVDLFDVNALFQIIDNGDGTFTIDGPDEYIQALNPTTFTVDWPKVVYINEETYKLRSW